MEEEKILVTETCPDESSTLRRVKDGIAAKLKADNDQSFNLIHTMDQNNSLVEKYVLGQSILMTNPNENKDQLQSF